MKKTIVIILALMAAAAVFLISRVAWMRVWRASVVLDKSNVKSARVYKSRTGELLIDFREEAEVTYLVRPGQVGVPPSWVFYEFPFFAIAREDSVRVVDLRDEKAGASDTRLSIKPERVTFVGLQGRLVQVTLKQ